MQFLQPVFSGSGSEGPVWSRTRKKKASAAPFINGLALILAFVGALTIVMSIKERSVQAAGVVMDGWMQTGWNGALTLIGKAPKAADDAARKTGSALEAGATAAAEDLKS